MAHRIHGAGLAVLDPAGAALGQQQLDDALAGVVAEELAAVLLVVADAVGLHQRDELRSRVARQGRAAEVGVGAEVVRRRRIAIGEVAAPAAGNADLFGHPAGVVQQQHAHPPGSRE
jgi:hypothetical protein